jgi:threonine/homoserine/homoserine lactone efflux protein
MTLSTYLLYSLAVSLLIVTPGPTMLVTLTNSVNHGPWRALASLSGALAANSAIMMLSALGLGAILAAPEAAFSAPSPWLRQAQVVRWINRACGGLFALLGGLLLFARRHA